MHMVIVRHKCNCTHYIDDYFNDQNQELDSTETYNYVTKDLMRVCSQLERGFDTLYRERKFMTDFECICIKNQKFYEKESIDEFINEKACQTEAQHGKFRRNWKLIQSVINNPLYLILCITHVSFQWA